MTNQSKQNSQNSMRVLLLIVIVLLIVVPSAYLLPAITIILFLVSTPQYYVHRRLTRRLFESDGFRLTTFERCTEVVRRDRDPPLRGLIYSYRGIISSEPGERFDFRLSIVGNPWSALILPEADHLIVAPDDLSCDDMVMWLHALQDLKSLKELDLRNSHMTEDELPYLIGMDSLEVLHLGSTEITNRGRECLSQLPKLKVLDLGDTKISDDGLERLKQVGQPVATFPRG